MPCMLVSGCWIVGVVLILLWLLLSRVTNLSFVYMTDAGILEYCHYFKGLNALPHFTVGPSFAYGTTRQQIFCSADDTHTSKARCVVSDQMVENLLSNCNFSSFFFLTSFQLSMHFSHFVFVGRMNTGFVDSFTASTNCAMQQHRRIGWSARFRRLLFLVVKTSCK